MRRLDQDWKGKCEKISYKEFWDDMVFAPIKRIGFSDGPGAVFHGEPYNLRICLITNKNTTTHTAHFVVKNTDGEPEYYRLIDLITLRTYKRSR
jgi:hypothetical protein